MYKRLIIFISLLFCTAVTVIIVGTIMINRSAWEEVKKKIYKEKAEIIDYYIEQQILELDALVYSHVTLSEIQEMVRKENTEWLFMNATDHLLSNKYLSIDFIMATNEDLTYEKYWGDNISKYITEEKVFKDTIINNKITNKIIWINNKAMFLICSPLFNDNGKNPFGSFVVGEWINNDKLNKLKNVLGNKSISELTVTENRLYNKITDNNYSSISFSYDISTNEAYSVFVNVTLDTPIYNRIFIEQNKNIYIIILIVAILCFIVCLLYFKKLLNVIVDIIKVVTKISVGNYSARAHKTYMKETDKLVDAVNKMATDITYRIDEIDENYISMIEIMLNAVELNDAYTSHHSFKVGRLAKYIGKELNYEDIDSLYTAGRLHDIGKISTPKEILNKPGRLTKEEYEIIKEHPVAGYKLMDNIEYFNKIKMGVLYHHERFDGKGYPEGLKGDEIPMIAQIISVADVFDALSSDRPYRKGYSVEHSINIIKENSGEMFNPIIVDAFLKIYKYI
jgi:putative nucleotidyltransferase with HDIG domain